MRDEHAMLVFVQHPTVELTVLQKLLGPEAEQIYRRKSTVMNKIYILHKKIRNRILSH